MPQNCLLAYISIKLRKILNPPFLEEPPLSGNPPFQMAEAETPLISNSEIVKTPLNLGGEGRNYAFTEPLNQSLENQISTHTLFQQLQLGYIP